jgi:hypothetical protein
MLDSQKTLKRLFIIGAIYLAALTATSLLWSWQHSVSAFVGGMLILSSASATNITITIGMRDKQKSGGKTWWHLVPRLLLIALCGYAMLQAPWMEYISLVFGLSLFFPALVVEVVLEGIALRQRKDLNRKQT